MTNFKICEILMRAGDQKPEYQLEWPYNKQTSATDISESPVGKISGKIDNFVLFKD